MSPEDEGVRHSTVDELHYHDTFPRLTHYLFRYPAKFHPPVVRELLSRYTAPGDSVLDPFCGSGTMLVEAAALGRSSTGVDVDPVAVAVARVKSHRFAPRALANAVAKLAASADSVRRGESELNALAFGDIDDGEYDAQRADLHEWIPEIPNLDHWFKRYVVIDLARIARAIHACDLGEWHRLFAQVVFAATIRNVSRADPVPVSGLEVTKWMKEREAKGRRIDTATEFKQRLVKAKAACDEFFSATSGSVATHCVVGDATRLTEFVRDHFDVVLTSPPYHGAVDYYRRHQLEMFWLGLTKSQSERLRLLQRYIGRPKVASSHPWVAEPLSSALAKEWEERIRTHAPGRANAFRHYATAMRSSIESIAGVVRPGGVALLVVGHSTWNGEQIPTTDLFEELAEGHFGLKQVLTYGTKNRYMSYDRRNEANINREYVLVMERSDG